MSNGNTQGNEPKPYFRKIRFFCNGGLAENICQNGALELL